MENQFSRTELLIGSEKLNTLKNAHVAVFGVGGVGGYCVEALARVGVGKLTLVDNDKVSVSNINRQIIATYSSVGKQKTEALKERILDINPKASVFCINSFYLPENADEIDLSVFDYVVDAVDTVSAKIELAKRCFELNVPIISSMGTGNKLNPLLFEVSDIYDTSVCPLARVMRRELKARNISSLKVVYSKEEPIKPDRENALLGENNKPIPGSISFCPSVSGLILASEVIKDLIR